MAFTAVPVLLLAISYAGGDVINGSLMRSLRCLGPHSPSSSCRVVGIEIPDSERLLQLYSSQSVRVRDALDKGNLTSLPEAILLTLHPNILYLIPYEAISELDINKIAALIQKWSGISPLVQHLFHAATLTNDTVSLLIRLQGVELLPTDEQIIARTVVRWSRNYSITSVGDLFVYLPTPYLYHLSHNDKVKEIVLLKLWLQTSPASSWYEKPFTIRRTWSVLLLNNTFTKNIADWVDKDLSEKLGPLLVGLSCKELSSLNADNFSKKLDIFKINFSPIQVRCLWNKFVSNRYLGNEIVERHNSLLGNLTAQQIAELPSQTQIQIKVKPSSLATARQLLEFCCANNETMSAKLLSARELVYSIPNQQNFASHDLSLDELLQIESELLSPVQAFYLTKKGSMLSPDDKRLKKFLSALPVAAVPSQLALDNILYLLKRVPAKTPLVAIKLLTLLPTNYIAQFDFLKYILKNPAKKEILELVPSKIVAKVLKQLNDSLPAATHLDLHLPDHIGAMLFSYNHSSIIIEYADCQEIEETSNVDLPFYLSLINARLGPTGMKKDLQECWSRKLVEYIHLKSSFVQQYLDERLFELLAATDISAAGGYVLAMFEENDILNSSHLEEIIYTMGRLSHAQILTAAPRKKFHSLIDIYLKKKIGRGDITFNQLYEMGNLTLLLNLKSIPRIKDFRTLLESRLIDTRLCSSSFERRQWRSLLLSALGPCNLWTGEEMLLAQNLMIALNKEDFDSIPAETILDAIDQIQPSLYAELIPNHFTKHDQHIPKFYQVCMSTMDELERASYRQSLKSMILFFIRGLTLQLNSVQKISFSDQEEITTLKTQVPLPESSKLPRNAEILISESSTPTVDITLTTPSQMASGQTKQTELFDDFEFEPVILVGESNQEEPTTDTPQISNTDLLREFNHQVEVVADASALVESKQKIHQTVLSSLSEESDEKKVNMKSTNTNPPGLSKMTYTATSKYETARLNTSSTEAWKSLPFSSASSTLLNSSHQDYVKIDSSKRFTTIYPMPSTSDEISFASDKPGHSSYSFTSAPHADFEKSHLRNENVTTSSFMSRNNKLVESRTDSEMTVLITTRSTSRTSLFSPTPFDGSSMSADLETSITTLSPMEDADQKSTTVTPYTEASNPPSEQRITPSVTLSTITRKISEVPVIKSENSDTSKVERPALNEFSNLPQNHKTFNSESSKPTVDVTYTTPSQMTSGLSEKTGPFDDFEFGEVREVESDEPVISTTPSTVASNKARSYIEIPYGDNMLHSLGEMREVESDKPVAFNSKSSKPTVDVTFTTPSQMTSGLSKETDPFDDFEFGEVRDVESDEPVISTTPSTVATNTAHSHIGIPYGKDFVLLKTQTSKLDESENVIEPLTVTSSTQWKTETTVEARDYDHAKEIVQSKINSNLFKGSTEALNDEIFVSITEPSPRLIRQLGSNKQDGAICGALRSIGIISEVGIDKKMLDSMSAAEIEDCSDLFGSMDLPPSEMKIIWKSLKKEDLHLKGSLVSALTLHDVEHINFDLNRPWVLETIYTLSEYNSDLKLAKGVIEKALWKASYPLSTETLAAFGPYLCHVHNPNWLKGENLLQASRILGWRLNCERPCLHKILVASQNPHAFGPMSNWTRYDVETLGIIVAGMEDVEWANFVTSCPDCITGLTKKAALCLPESHIKLIPEHIMKKLSWTTRKTLEVNGRPLGSAIPVDSISLERSPLVISKSSATGVNWIVTLLTALIVLVFANC